jgi:hypothetical protein
VMLDQRVYHPVTADDQNVLTGLLLELVDVSRDIPLNQP